MVVARRNDRLMLCTVACRQSPKVLSWHKRTEGRAKKQTKQSRKKKVISGSELLPIYATPPLQRITPRQRTDQGQGIGVNVRYHCHGTLYGQIGIQPRAVFLVSISFPPDSMPGLSELWATCIEIGSM
jgi:hypothetical protein